MKLDHARFHEIEIKIKTTLRPHKKLYFNRIVRYIRLLISSTPYNDLPIFNSCTILQDSECSRKEKKKSFRTFPCLFLNAEIKQLVNDFQTTCSHHLYESLSVCASKQLFLWTSESHGGNTSICASMNHCQWISFSYKHWRNYSKFHFQTTWGTRLLATHIIRDRSWTHYSIVLS